MILNAGTYTSFDNQPVSSTDVLVKYTYVGDANLDGEVDGSDYTLIDNGFNNKLTGWYNGDLNYDGNVDGSDYTLIDNSLDTQDATFATLIAKAEPQVSVASELTTAAKKQQPNKSVGTGSKEFAAADAAGSDSWVNSGSSVENNLDQSTDVLDQLDHKDGLPDWGKLARKSAGTYFTMRS